MYWTWMNGCTGGKGKRNCAQPHLSGKENRVHIETKGAFYGGAIFCAAISACWFRGIILKNSWCNSLPGTPGCSRDQSSHILKLDVFRLLPTESFSRPVPVRLFTDAPFVAFNPPHPLHSQGLMFAPLQAWVPQPAEGNNELKLEKRK